MNHQGMLFYTTDDDGIWLGCECGFRLNLDFSPSPETAVFELEKHRRSERDTDRDQLS